MDVETIEIQKKEISELRDDNKMLHEEIKMLRKRIARLERGLSPDSEEDIRERESDTNPLP
jgi:FtsZ-binding cell division protein ZapB